MAEIESQLMSNGRASAIWRAIFWSTYILGTISFVVLLLLALVPRDRHSDLTVDYIFQASIAAVLLICLLVARRCWKTLNPFSRYVNISLMLRALLFILWFEFIVASGVLEVPLRLLEYLAKP